MDPQFPEGQQGQLRKGQTQTTQPGDQRSQQGPIDQKLQQQGPKKGVQTGAIQTGQTRIGQSGIGKTGAGQKGIGPDGTGSNGIDQKGAEIVFRPLTEGLGFHPFSDGLPYAPLAKNAKASSSGSGTGATSVRPSNAYAHTPPTYEKPSPYEKAQLNSGTGAVSAGNPRIARALSIPRITVPVAGLGRPPANTALAPHSSGSKASSLSGNVTISENPIQTQELPRAKVRPQSKTVHATASRSASPHHSTALHSSHVHYGWVYLAKRLTACWIDFILNSVLFAVGVTALMLREDSNIDVFSNSTAIIMTCILWLFFHWFLVTAQEVLFGASVGKRFLGLSLKGNPIAILLRAILFIPSILPLGLGLLWCLVDSKKRCLHDRIVGVQPFELG